MQTLITSIICHTPVCMIWHRTPCLMLNSLQCPLSWWILTSIKSHLMWSLLTSKYCHLLCTPIQSWLSGYYYLRAVLPPISFLYFVQYHVVLLVQCHFCVLCCKQYSVVVYVAAYFHIILPVCASKNVIFCEFLSFGFITIFLLFQNIKN